MTFPTANSSVYYNEDGEVLGWDVPMIDPYDNDPYLYDDHDRYDYDEPDVWGDEEACKDQGFHGESLNRDRADGEWVCAACGERVPEEEEADDPLGIGSPAWDLD